MDYAAIVLAGGASRRMGGVLKPLLTVDGVALLDRVLRAVGDADPIVVVGPSEVERPGIAVRVREEPPGGGPVAGIAAGIRACGNAEFVAVLAGDLPFVTPDAIRRLHAALTAHAECAVFVDDEGRPQSMVAMWRADSLQAALAEQPAAGRSVRSLMARPITAVPWTDGLPQPWYDCDTPEELKEAHRWL